ncbi:hypothetical protein ZWY2020_040515 [Hordeum vulgare]|nr:hypothetical protein ZWY2020_040515 [Hordeum vulgare]
MSILKRADPTIVAPTGEIVVMKFDGSSIPAKGLKVVAELVRDISTHKSLVVFLSGMGNTENNILQVLAKVLMYDKDQKVGEYEEFSISQQLYLSTAREVELNIVIVTGKLMFCMQVEQGKKEEEEFSMGPLSILMLNVKNNTQAYFVSSEISVVVF